MDVGGTSTRRGRFSQRVGSRYGGDDWRFCLLILLDDVADDLRITLSELDAPDGATAVLGNHDHWTDAARMRELLTDSGATVLD